MPGTDGFFFFAGDGFLVAKYALMRTAGVGQKYRDDEWAVLGSWMLDAGCFLLDTGYWILYGCLYVLILGYLISFFVHDDSNSVVYQEICRFRHRVSSIKHPVSKAVYPESSIKGRVSSLEYRAVSSEQIESGYFF